ncbi:MAG TPA: type II secretion system F family protein, partial [Vicinamibacteria bacterium]
MTESLFVLPGLLALAILSGVLGLRRIRNVDRVTERLRRIRSEGSDAPTTDLFDRPLPIWARALSLLSWLLPFQRNSSILHWELAGAGLRHQDAPNAFVGLRILLAVGLGFGALWGIRTYAGLVGTDLIVLAGVAALVGFVAPWMVLRLKQKQRRQEITLALPDALDLMVICVEAGQGLNAALLNVSRESSLHSHSMAEELRIVNLEMSTGIPRVQALRNLALRSGIDDVRSLVAVLVQSDKFGTSVAQALRTHARSLRIRRRQRAEEAARKTPVKMLFPLVFC